GAPTGDPIGGLLEHAQKWAEAGDMDALRNLLQGIPVDAERKAARLVEISYEQSLAGRYRQARTAALMAAALGPRAPKARAELASRLRTFNDVGTLRAMIADSGPLSRIPIPLLISYAAQLSYLNCA